VDSTKGKETLGDLEVDCERIMPWEKGDSRLESCCKFKNKRGKGLRGEKKRWQLQECGHASLSSTEGEKT